MKKVKLFLMFIIGMLIFSINVKAADTYGIKCDKAYVNEPFACSVIYILMLQSWHFFT